MIFLVASALGAGAAQAQQIDLAAGGADPVWRGTQAGSRAGAWLDQGPLNNSDSRRDLIMGVPGGPGIAGAVYVVYGGPIRTGDLLVTAADAAIHGAANGDLFGTSTAVGNILTTEGTAPRTLAVGAPGALSNKGIVYLFNGNFGSAASVSASDAVVQVIGAAGDQLGVALAAGDLNNDGYRELIIGAPGNNRVYVIKGGPSLPSTIDLSVTAAAITFQFAGFGPVIAAGDITGDGIYDLLIGQVGGNAVHVLKGRNGVMPPAALDMTFGGIDAGDGVGGSIRLADIDADGISDVFIGAPDGDGPGNSRVNSGEVYLLFGGASLTGRSMASADVTFYGVDANGRMGASLAAGDINRDSPNDIVFNTPGSRNGAGVLYVYYGRRSHTSYGTARPDGTRQVDFGATAPDRSILGDLAGGTITAAQVFEVTGEGARDIIVGMSGTNNNTGSVYFAISPRMSLNHSSQTINGAQGTSTTASLQVINASTIPVTWSSSSNRPWLTATPSGSSSAGTAGSLVVTANGNGMAPGSYTGTITVTSTSNHLVMSLPLAVTFVVRETQPTPASPPAGGAGPGAIYKILWRHSTDGWLAFWNMNGITMTSQSSLSINQMADANWRIAGFGDLNGDGQRDIVWQHSVDGYLAVWYLQGDTVTSSMLLSINRVDPVWQIRGVGDTNGDGRADLLFQNTSDGSLGVWFMNGAQVIGSSLLSIPQMADSNWKIMAAGDVDGDGKSDIVWQNKSQGWLAVWLLNGAQVTSSRLLSVNKMTDPNWTIVAAQDVNGDRKADIIWQHTDGSLATWWLNAEQVTATMMLNPGRVASPAWKIAGPK